MTAENISWSDLHERMLPTRRGSNPQTLDHQSDAHPTEPPRDDLKLKGVGRSRCWLGFPCVTPHLEPVFCSGKVNNPSYNSFFIYIAVVALVLRLDLQPSSIYLQFTILFQHSYSSSSNLSTLTCTFFIIKGLLHVWNRIAKITHVCNILANGPSLPTICHGQVGVILCKTMDQ